MSTESITQKHESLIRKAGLKPRSKQRIWMVLHLYLVPVGVFSLVGAFSLMCVLVPALPHFLFFIVAVAVTCVILFWSGGIVFRAYRDQSNGAVVASTGPSIIKRLITYYGIILLTVSVIFFSGCFLTSQFPDKDKLSERAKNMEKIFIHELTD